MMRTRPGVPLNRRVGRHRRRSRRISHLPSVAVNQNGQLRVGRSRGMLAESDIGLTARPTMKEASVFDQFNGMPVHVLLVHAAVVFVPLLVLAAVVYAVVPR